jgi:sulfide:quinone oxidoreductase
MVANTLQKELDESEWQIPIIDREEEHHFQSGYLFIPFGLYSKNDVLKPKKEFIPQSVEFVVDEVINIDKDHRRVKTALGEYDYDWLVIATGCRIAPEEIDGMMDGWGKDIFDFYTLEGAIALRKKLKYFKTGKIVLNIAEIPYKCPIAPLEFVFMADGFFTVTRQIPISRDGTLFTAPGKSEQSLGENDVSMGLLEPIGGSDIFC